MATIIASCMVWGWNLDISYDEGINALSMTTISCCLEMQVHTPKLAIAIGSTLGPRFPYRTQKHRQDTVRRLLEIMWNFVGHWRSPGVRRPYWTKSIPSVSWRDLNTIDRVSVAKFQKYPAFGELFIAECRIAFSTSYT